MFDVVSSPGRIQRSSCVQRTSSVSAFWWPEADQRTVARCFGFSPGCASSLSSSCSSSHPHHDCCYFPSPRYHISFHLTPQQYPLGGLQKTKDPSNRSLFRAGAGKDSQRADGKSEKRRGLWRLLNKKTALIFAIIALASSLRFVSVRIPKMTEVGVFGVDSFSSCLRERYQASQTRKRIRGVSDSRIRDAPRR